MRNIFKPKPRPFHQRTTVVGKLKECCKNPRNRFKIHHDTEAQVIVEKCGVCDAKHYRMHCEPILFGVDGQPIG